MEDLFRQQAVDEKRSGVLGSVQVSVSKPMRLLSLLFLAICVCICVFVAFGTYTRREQASGVILPVAGLIQLDSNIAGTITQVYAHQGDRISANHPLIALSSEKLSSAFGATEGEVIAQLRAQKLKLHSDVKDLVSLESKQADALHAHISALKSQLEQVDGQIELLKRQVQINKSLLEKIRPLEMKGYISTLQIQQQESALLDQQIQVKSTTRDRIEMSQQLSAQQAQLDQLPLTMEAQKHDLERKISDVDQSLAQNELQRSTVLVAPTDATIASSLASLGQSVKQGQTLMVLAPANSPLHARLLLPTRSIGFIKKGDRVVLRYQAFPYQQFGVHEGWVTDVAKSPLPPDQASELSGQQVQEPMYTVDVDLAEQEITAYDGKHQLKPGMQIDADIMLDKRTLVEWIFEPLYSVSKRLADRGNG